MNDFSVAQGFTPGNEKAVSFKSPINGALIASRVSLPGVNAWAREKAIMKPSHHRPPGCLEGGLVSR
jgi:hypothetical protein